MMDYYAEESIGLMMLSRFGTIPERDRRTDTQTDRQTDRIPISQYQCFYKLSSVRRLQPITHTHVCTCVPPWTCDRLHTSGDSI